MDVPSLLRQARQRAEISQRELAKRTATSKSAISTYESGGMSPTVRTLDRLLAACGVEARVVLQPLGADLDAQVLSLMAGASELDVETLLDFQRSLDDDPLAFRAAATPWQATGAVTWAFDGATALRLHGLAVAEQEPAVIVVLDDAARHWLTRLGVRGTGRIVAPHWLDYEPEYLEEALAWPAVCGLGRVRIRLCDALPPVVRIVIGDQGQAVPVATADAVEQTHPEYAEVLAAWRVRRTVHP